MKTQAAGFRIYGVAAILLAFLAGQTVLSMRTKSATADEFHHHIASGYSYLVTGNFKMNPASPPFPRLLAAVPLYFLGAKAPLDHESWAKGNSPEFARQFFYHANDRPDEFIFWARVPFAALSVLFGLAVFLFSRHLFGNIAALVSLALYSFCPDIIAHSGLAGADMPVAFFFFLTLVSFWFYLKKPSLKGIALTGVALGMTFLSKFSAIVLLPILFLAALLGGKWKEISFPKTMLCLLFCFLTVWAGYFFEVKPLLKDTPDPLKKEAMYRKVGGEELLFIAEKVPLPLSTFASAFVSMMYTRAAGTDAYLMGEWSRNGWWYYYFVAFCIKNTIPLLLLSIISFILIPKLKLDRLTLFFFAVPVALFFTATLRDKAQAGIRYFLPIYPLLFVLCGGTADWLMKRSKLLKAAVIALLAWHVSASLLVFPDYLAYFNELIGGPRNGYKYLRDSNIDWGQDLKGLEQLAEKEGYTEIVLISLGSPNPKLPVRRISPEESVHPRKTVYAIGAHQMGSLLWTKDRLPTQVLGHSLFVYDLRAEKGSPPDA